MSTMLKPSQLSHELRIEDTDELNRRRWIVGLSLFGTVMAQIVSLYQVGVIKRLPDPPIEIFDSSKVDASNYAYKRFDVPDGVIMLVSYGFTAWLAAAGGKNRAAQQPLYPIATGLKTLADTGLALQLATEEYAENKKLCIYCQLATAASVLSAILAFPEMIAGIRTLVSRRD